MARTATPRTDDNGAPVPRKARSPSAPKNVYAIIQVLDEAGEPMSLAKARVRVISFEKSGEAVLTKIESGDYPNALYLRGQVPAGR